MREATARCKYCPLFAIAMAIKDQEAVTCKAIDCMFWVEEPEPDGEKFARKAQFPVVAADRYGYCGLIVK